MNQRILSIRLLALVLTMTIVGCAKPRTILQDFRADRIMHYSQMNNIDDLSGCVFYLDRGEKMPLKMTLESDVVEVADEEIFLTLRKKVYFRLRMPDGMNAEKISSMHEANNQKFFKSFMIFLSLDAQRWAPYTDIKAVKKVLGLKGGSVSFGMGVTKEDGLIALLKIKADKM